MIHQNHVDLLSGRVHAVLVPTRATATAAGAAAIIRYMCLRSGAGCLRRVGHGLWPAARPRRGAVLGSCASTPFGRLGCLCGRPPPGLSTAPELLPTQSSRRQALPSQAAKMLLMSGCCVQSPSLPGRTGFKFHSISPRIPSSNIHVLNAASVMLYLFLTCTYAEIMHIPMESWKRRSFQILHLESGMCSVQNPFDRAADLILIQ